MKTVTTIFCAVLVISLLAAVTARSPTKPPCPRKCPDVYDPVCYLGITFANYCDASNAECLFEKHVGIFLRITDGPCWRRR